MPDRRNRPARLTSNRNKSGQSFKTLAPTDDQPVRSVYFVIAPNQIGEAPPHYDALPRNLAWAAPSPPISAAFAEFAAAVGREGAEALDRPSRTLIEQRVAAWEGDFPPPTPSWVDEAVTELDREARPGARLGLLAALAPDQIDAELIDAYRAQGADDRQIVSAIAWASFKAAARVAEWIAVPLDDRVATAR